MTTPIIVKFLSERCISTKDSASVVECVGLDDQGQTWTFLIENRWSYDHELNPHPTMSVPYGFTRVKTDHQA